MKQILMLAVLAFVAAGQGANQAEVQLQAAIKAEVFDGNLKAAIERYQRIIASFGNDRPVVAKALVRMGQCYEKLGDAQAREGRKAYERVVREFADQKEAVEQARALLAAGSGERQSETGITVQLKRVLPAGRQTQMRHVSPDGRYIPFDASGNVWLHDLTTGEERRVVEGKPGSRWASSAELSPDSQQIAYLWPTRNEGPFRYELRIAGIDGSGMRVLMTDKERPPIPKAWSPDGKRILILRQNPTAGFSLALVSVADGSEQVLTARDDVSNGCFSPDGKYIVTYRFSVDGKQFVRVPAGLKLVPVDGSEPVPLFESSATNWAPFWTPDGRRIVFLSDRSGTVDLWSIRMSGGRPQGEPELLKREAGSIDPDPIGFTRDGLFYYKASTYQSDVYSAELDPTTGRVTSKPIQVNQRFVGSAGYPMAWSPDGQFLAYTRISRRELGYPVSKGISIIVRSERTGEEREISPVPAFNQGYPKTLLWLPDGRSLLADDSVNGFLFHQIDLQTGQTKVFDVLGGSIKDVWYPALSHDGKALFYVQHAPYVQGAERVCRLMRRDMESGEVRELYQAKDVEVDNPALSADGRQLAFEVSDWNREPNTFSLMIMPAEGGEPRELLRSRQYIVDNAWMRSGRHLLMVRESESGSPGLWTIPVDGGEPQPSGLAIAGGGYGIRLHPDGRRIAFGRKTGPVEEVWVIKNLLSAPAAPRK